MQLPTAQQFESVLKGYTVKAILSILSLLGVFFQEQLVAYLERMTHQSLSALAGWLVVSTMVVALLFFYFLARHLVTKKALLSVEPNYYINVQAEKDFNKGFLEATELRNGRTG